MRVAFDVSSTRGAKTGIGVYTEQLIQALRTFAPEVDVVELGGADASQRTDRRIWREQLVLARRAREAGADLLHLTGFGSPLRTRVPVVLTVMDLIGALFPRNFPPAARFYWSRYLPFTVRGARQIVTLSENTRRDLLRLTSTPVERITVVPPGLETRWLEQVPPETLEQIRARLKLPARYFLFVSTLEPRKGLDTLIGAFHDIARQVAEDLVLVGQRGWYVERIVGNVETAGLSGRVHLAEYVDQADLPGVYRMATAFVFPSRYEGFGLTPLEAMACGTPVISSNAASLPEVVGDAGVLLPPEDKPGFANAMRALARDPARRDELGRRGAARARTFTWEKAAQEMAAVYERALSAEAVG